MDPKAHSPALLLQGTDDMNVMRRGLTGTCACLSKTECCDKMCLIEAAVFPNICPLNTPLQI